MAYIIKKSNKEVYSAIERITETIRKRRSRYYGHLKRMTKQIFHFFDSKPETKMPWFVNTKDDLKVLHLTPDDVFNRAPFRKKILTNGLIRDEPKRRQGTSWTAERKLAHSQRMREFWTQKKAKQTAKCYKT